MRTARLILSLFVLGCLGTVVLAGENESAVSSSANAAEQVAGRKVLVYYLYVMPRCQTCLNIEAYSKAAIDSAFAEELKQGTVEWHAYDTGLPEYAHFWKDFKLEFKSLIVVEMNDGKPVRWKNCEKVWDLVEDRDAFEAYVRAEVRDYLIPK
jgi:hypothetical protein